MKVLITQSNYIPWKGYFDAIRQADLFVIYDDVQYTRRDWRNRNRIKTQHGLQWLTIPVHVKGKFHQLIQEVEVLSGDWAMKHWNSIRHAYHKAPFFAAFEAQFEEMYQQAQSLSHLSEINTFFLKEICQILEVETLCRRSAEFEKEGNASERLLQICQQVEASTYLSSPRAQAYLDLILFEKAGIEVEWLDFSGYPVYPQLHGDFEEKVSVVDMIFNLGKAAKDYF